VASLLIGAGGVGLRELERETGKAVYVRGSEECRVEDVRVRAVGSREEARQLAVPVRAGQTMELKVEQTHMSNAADGIARIRGYVIDIEGAGGRVGETVRVEITKAYRTYARARLVDGVPQPAAGAR
jgi:ribonuclease G